jgi:hypothetical protein
MTSVFYGIEPSLSELLSDEIIQALMKADKVNTSELRNLIRSVSPRIIGRVPTDSPTHFQHQFVSL